MNATSQRELIWMQFPNNHSLTEPEALGLSSELADCECFTCSEYCTVCRGFCLCNSLDICVTKFCWNN